MDRHQRRCCLVYRNLPQYGSRRTLVLTPFDCSGTPVARSESIGHPVGGLHRRDRVIDGLAVVRTEPFDGPGTRLTVRLAVDPGASRVASRLRRSQLQLEADTVDADATGTEAAASNQRV